MSPTRHLGDAQVVDVLWTPFPFHTEETVRAVDGEGAPNRTPADMQGKKARVFGTTQRSFLTPAGGAVPMVSGSEPCVGCQRGTVEAGMTDASGLNAISGRR